MNRRIFLHLGCGLLLWSASVHADTFSPLFLQAATSMHVPSEWTQAIAQVESRRMPFALNIEGRGYLFHSKEAALARARQAQVEGRSFDSGIMQVNNQWLRKYDIPLEAALDPEANIWLGSWILSREIQQRGRNWSAVAHYHSPDPARGRQYVDLVRAAIERGPVGGKQSPQKPIPKKTVSPVQDSIDKNNDPAAFVVYRGADQHTFVRAKAAQMPPETIAFVRRMHMDEQ